MPKIAKKNSALVSLLMPVKNAGAFLAETITSLQNQDYKQWELMAVNDHSSDDSWAILLMAAAEDTRIKLWTNPAKGILPALQLAFAQSKGTFVGRLDADDLLPPQRLSQMTSALSLKGPKTVVTGKVKYFSAATISAGYLNYEQWLNQILQEGRAWQQVYRECVVASPNWLMHRSTLAEIGGFNGLSYPEDYDLVFRWYEHSLEVHCLPQVTLLWREHAARTSRNSENYQQAAFFKLKLQRFVSLEQPLQNLVLWGTGIKGKLAAKQLLAQNVSFCWMALQPEKHPEGLLGRAIESYVNLNQIESPKVLLAVYPPPSERARLEKFLANLRLKEGKQWWYL